MSLVNNFTVKKVRSSNLELLRLLSMFFVLVVHADFQALGMPDRTEMTILPLFSVFRIYETFFCGQCRLVFYIPQASVGFTGLKGWV